MRRRNARRPSATRVARGARGRRTGSSELKRVAVETGIPASGHVPCTGESVPPTEPANPSTFPHTGMSLARTEACHRAGTSPAHSEACHRGDRSGARRPSHGHVHCMYTDCATSLARLLHTMKCANDDRSRGSPGRGCQVPLALPAPSHLVAGRPLPPTRHPPRPPTNAHPRRSRRPLRPLPKQ